MSEYLKMADVFNDTSTTEIMGIGSAQIKPEFDDGVTAFDYAAHAINSHDALVAQRDELLAELEDLKREIILSDVDMDYIDSHFRPWLNKATLAIDNAKGGAA